MIGVSILIALASIVVLMALHELGHFLLAIMFKMPVEEFGLGLPPRLVAWHWKSILISLNWLPFGAFVRIKGEEDESKEGFASFPAWQRALVLIGGVTANWLTAVVLFAIVAGGWGLPYAISDKTVSPNAKLEVIMVNPQSPAHDAGLKEGDWILAMGTKGRLTPAVYQHDFSEFVDRHLGEAVDLKIQRGKTTQIISVTPRENPPAGQGAIGIGFARVAIQHYAWYKSLWVGLQATANQTVAIPMTFGAMFSGWIHHHPMPGAQLVGPIGIGKMIAQTSRLGVAYLLQFVAMIAVYLSLFNILPLPALDGGKLLFLAIEGIKKKPINAKLKAALNNSFFVLFLLLLVWVTVKDLIHLF